MAVHADRTRGRKRGAPRPGERVLVYGRRRAVLSAGLTTVALLTAFTTPAAAQQTVIIGGPAIIGPGAGGLIVNNEVLESLGPSLEVPALPYQGPGRGFGGAPVMPVTPGFLPGTVLGPGVGTVPGIAYRQPDTGQLLVTRPGRLLFPPPRAPRSRLATAMPEAPMAQPEPELTSRLLVPPPPQSARAPEPAPVVPAPVEPVVEMPVAAAEPEAVAPAPPPAPPLAPPLAPKAPEPQVAAQPEPSLPEPSEPVEAPPPPSTLAEELTKKPAPAEPSQEPATVAPAAPAAPAPAPAESEPPPPPAESLTAGPAVEPQTAALPPAPALAEQIRVLFQDGSVELSSDAKRRLSAVATALMESPTVRIQLLAYAKASSDGASRARRLSLSRALAVRAFLIEKGVRSTRMDVRALGDKIGDGPADRVDIRPQTAN